VVSRICARWSAMSCHSHALPWDSIGLNPQRIDTTRPRKPQSPFSPSTGKSLVTAMFQDLVGLFSEAYGMPVV
jgi:hypothetical protein